MSLDSSKKAILLAGVIVGLVAATALVAGYVERPGQAAGIAANEHNCGGCPLAGTDVCCRAKCQGECGDDCCGVCAQPNCAAPSGCQMKAKAGYSSPMGCSRTQ